MPAHSLGAMAAATEARMAAAGMEMESPAEATATPRLMTRWRRRRRRGANVCAGSRPKQRHTRAGRRIGATWMHKYT